MDSLPGPDDKKVDVSTNDNAFSPQKSHFFISWSIFLLIGLFLKLQDKVQAELVKDNSEAIANEPKKEEEKDGQKSDLNV